MSTKPTVGQAIDQIIAALGHFESKEQSTILATVCSLLNVTPIRNAGAPNLPLVTPTGSNLPPPSLGLPPATSGMDIRSLKIAKEPSSAREMACLVAFYLAELAPPDERKNTINSSDIEKYFKQAGYKLPSALEQVLPDSKKSGYFENESRGEYKLTRVGHNQVVHNMGKRDRD